ncbi:MAG: S1C family serine protease [Oscillospiraceae bacterium]|nr:S1C family serine protease [Oscillospiraceae bacterium]
MNEQEDKELYSEEESTYHYVYSDAHYEPADSSTVPPRYYTPRERTAREHRKKKSSSGRMAGLICVTLAAAILGGVCGASITGQSLTRRIDQMEEALQTYEDALLQQQNNEETAANIQPVSSYSGLSPSRIYDMSTGQVVGIRTEVTVTNFFGMTSSGAVSGTGFIISEDGYILTNFHVVEEAYERKLDIQVITYDGTRYGATIIGVEAINDIAVLKIDAENLSAAAFGNSDSLKVGDTVYAVGNPLGELEFSMSTGHVSALDRVISTQESESINMFQIDAAVNEGNSGGPVYNTEGEVIGIVTAKYSDSGVEGLGFAIPINDVVSIAGDLITKGYVTGKAFLGISVDYRYNSVYSQYYNMPLGAFVSEVTPDSAAEKAGLKTGDIITAVGDYQIKSYNELKTALRYFSAFESSELTVYRAGTELHLAVTFDEEKPT